MNRRNRILGSLALCAALAGAAPVGPPAGAGRAPKDARAADASAPSVRAVDGHGEPGDCLRCHEKISEVIAKPVRHEPAAEGQCTGCHAPHAARFDKLLNKRERALCATCHGEAIEGFLKGNVHAPIKQGECTSCHEVHGSQNEHLLAKDDNSLCLGCHQEHAALAGSPHVHDPFATGACTDCHAPHNSAQKALLAAPEARLCQLCHQAQDAALVEKHAGIPIEGSRCTGCHAPHASQSDGLLRPVVHSPFGDKSCEMCHMTDSDTPKVVRATGGKLCGMCHKDTPRKEDRLVHKPVADRDCGACHVPHAADAKGLLASPPAELCSKCHADVTARAKESKSAHPIDPVQGSCLACHAPHSSGEDALLVNGPIRTCLSCHETASHGHPLGEDRLDPRTGKAITCVTCHDPHGTPFSYTLRGDQSRGLCVDCHDPDVKKPRDAGRR